MIKLKLKEISYIVNGKLICKKKDINKSILNISINSKNINKKCLFITYKGKNFNSYIFIKDSIKNGAKAILTDKIYLKSYIPQILVKNINESLELISIWIKNKINPFTVTITGSSGKTTVKELVSFVLIKNKYNIVSTFKNNNNYIGVILTLLNINIKTKFLILEIGSSSKYEIFNMIKIINPSLILINNIYISHMKYFKNFRILCDSKSEIFFSKSNILKILLNYDNNYWFNWKFLNVNINKNPIFYSLNNCNNTDFYFKNITYNKFYKFNVITPIGNKNIKLHKNILFNNISYLYNTIAAISILVNLGLNLNEILKISNFKGIKGRLYPYFLKKKIILIDDSYNANIKSTINSLKILNSFKKSLKILIIGDMLELGKNEIFYHKLIGIYIKEYININYILSIGNLTKHIINYNKNISYNFNNINMILYKLISIINNNKNKKKIILIKGSRLNNLDIVVNKILKIYEYKK